MFVKWGDDVFVSEEFVRLGLIVKGFGIGCGSCLFFIWFDDRFVGWEDILKVSGGVIDFVRFFGF